MAQQVANMPYNCISGALHKLAFPLLAQKRREKADLNALILNMVAHLALFSIPLGAFLGWGGEELIRVFLGEKWLPMLTLFVACLVVANTAAFAQLNVAILKALGEVKVLSWFLTFRTLVTIPIYIFASLKGLEALAWTLAIVALLFTPVNIWLTCRALQIPCQKYLGCLFRPGFVSLIGISLSAIALKGIDASAWVYLPSLLIVTLVVVLLTLWCFERQTCDLVFARLRGSNHS